MATYYSLEYNEDGTSSIVENKDQSTRAITERDFNIGSYTGNQIVEPKEEITQPVDFIGEINDGPVGGSDDMNAYERFIDRSNLDTNPNRGGTEDSVFKKFIDALILAGTGVSTAQIQKVMDTIGSIFPKDSPEVKAIKEFYSNPENLKYFNPNSKDYIPGMENYNIIYGGFPGFKDPETGLQDAFQGRMDTIENTLRSKYGLSNTQIQQIKNGTYTGTIPINPATNLPTDLIYRYMNLAKVQSAEFDYMKDFWDEKDKGKKTGTDTTIMGDTSVDAQENQPDAGGFDPGQGFVDQDGQGEFGGVATTGNVDQSDGAVELGTMDTVAENTVPNEIIQKESVDQGAVELGTMDTSPKGPQPSSSNPIAQNRGKIHQEPKKEKQENRGGNNKGDAGGVQLSSGMTTGQHAAFRR